MKTKVIFRKFKEGDVIALFPCELANFYDGSISSYQHVGQHSGASPDLITELAPVTQDEYQSLHDEITRRGYDLELIDTAPGDELKVEVIEALFNEIHGGLFRTDCELSYQGIQTKLILLCSYIMTFKLDERVWSIGEGSECCLDDLIIGAYWFFSEWHEGQYSLSYATLCALGQVFQPGMSDGVEDDTGQRFTYDMLEMKVNEIKKAV